MRYQINKNQNNHEEFLGYVTTANIDSLLVKMAGKGILVKDKVETKLIRSDFILSALQIDRLVSQAK